MWNFYNVGRKILSLLPSTAKIHSIEIRWKKKIQKSYGDYWTLTSQTRQIRITELYKKAVTGKYNWKQLQEAARSLGVSEPTVVSYLRDVEARLKKAGYIKWLNYCMPLYGYIQYMA